MSSEDHARLRWVKSKEKWWPALLYKNMNETLRLSTQNTKILSEMFVQYYPTMKENEDRPVAYFLGSSSSSSDYLDETFMYLDNVEDENVVLPFYANFRRFNDVQDVVLQSALREAADRVCSEVQEVQQVKEVKRDDDKVKSEKQARRRRQCDILLEEQSQTLLASPCSSVISKRGRSPVDKRVLSLRGHACRKSKRKRTL